MRGAGGGYSGLRMARRAPGVEVGQVKQSGERGCAETTKISILNKSLLNEGTGRSCSWRPLEVEESAKGARVLKEGT